MKILVTGSGGLIGSEACFYWLGKGHTVSGIDNNMRQVFFGPKGDVTPNINQLLTHGKYDHHPIDIRNRGSIDSLLQRLKPDVIIHTAAQPSHDKAADIPFDDFEVNAMGTLNLLEGARQHCSGCVFIHMSTNKVYGDRPNMLPLIESDTRYDYDSSQISEFDGVSINGINENFSIDQSLHSLFGASKTSADIVAQEYGRYFGMNVGIFRGGCLTGPQHSGVELHGFLSYIIDCALSDTAYTVFGYKGKQVRDQIHSADVISCFEHFIEHPRPGEVYNLGGERENSASVLEVIDMITDICGKSLQWKYDNANRIGDHICYISDMNKFKTHYPSWIKQYPLKDIVLEIIEHKSKK